MLIYRVGHGPDRLALTLLDGPQAVVAATCTSLGLPVDHLVLIRFDGIRRLVDAVGGVSVTVEHRTRDLHTGLDLSPGTTLLDGAAAIAWVRSRHAEEFLEGRWVLSGDGDGSRQKNQRSLLRQLFEKFGEQVRNPIAARTLLRAVADSVIVDNRTGLVGLAQLARALGQHPVEDSLPHRYTPGPIPVAELSPRALPLLDDLRSSPPSQTCPRAHPQPDP